MNFWQRARLKSPKEASIKLQKKRRLPELCDASERLGFIEVEGRDDDIYVSEENIGNAFYGDVVQATLSPGRPGNVRKDASHRSSPIRSRKWLASMNRANILAL